jgi:hypothetical protein
MKTLTEQHHNQVHSHHQQLSCKYIGTLHRTKHVILEIILCYNFYAYVMFVCLFVGFWCNSPPVGQGLLIREVSRPLNWRLFKWNKINKYCTSSKLFTVLNLRGQSTSTLVNLICVCPCIVFIRMWRRKPTRWHLVGFLLHKYFSNTCTVLIT